MFIGDESAARRFDRVECDLSDVLGSPGVAQADEFAGRFGQSLDVRFEAFPADPGLFLRSVGVVGAFPSPSMALTEAAGAFDDVLGMTGTVRTRSRRGPAQQTGTRLVAKVASPSAQHEQYVQTMDGRRVIGGSYRVHAGRTGGEVRVSVTGAPIGDLDQRDPGPPPDPRRAGVRAAMRDQLGLHRGVKLRLETVLFPLQGGAVWAYLGRGIYRDEDTVADLRIIVNANDLGLLVSRDAAMSGFGEAHVFDANPARDPNTRAVRLPDLTGAELRSDIIDVRPSAGERPRRELRDWRVAVTDAEFDDMSAYYHLSRAANWFAPLIGPDLFTKAPFRPLTVITGDPDPQNFVGYFLPDEGLIAFCGGAKPGARSADICIHEFTHAVVWAAAQRIDDLSTLQARGLNEGYADYAQASLLDNPLMGDWVAGPKFQRDCSSAARRFPADLDHAPNDIFTRYEIGTAWAAVLWEIRQQIGADVADALAFDSIFYLDAFSSVETAHTALLAADAKLFPADDRTGRHTDVIENAFSRRIP